jgi:hypothetical protein
VNRDEGKGNLVNRLHMHIQNRMMKPLAIALSGTGRNLQGLSVVETI